MKCKIISLDWEPGYNISSSRGAKKYQISKARQNADYVKNNGYGNYNVITYSKYFATFEFEDGTSRSFDIKEQIKEHFNIARMTEKARCKIESLLPINVDVNDYDVTFLD